MSVDCDPRPLSWFLESGRQVGGGSTFKRTIYMKSILPGPGGVTGKLESREAGFTLTEVLIALVISTMLMGAVMSSYIFMAKSCVSLNDYTELDMETREAIETFSREVRAASDISGFSSSNMTLTVSGPGGDYTVNYTYVPGDQVFYRAYGTSDQKALLTGVESFSLKRFNLLHNPAINDLETKQIQLDAKTVRSGGVKFRATNNVLSARYIMRNKVASN
jgi:prepilin-type N-terminal cleavage/methylation domain-containing protein